MDKYVRRNGLMDRIDLRGQCTVAALKAGLAGTRGAFLLMDVEGAEDILLQPDIPRIDQTEILVELHELFVPGITRRLKESFADTHHIYLVKQRELKEQRPPSELQRALGRCGISFWRRLTDEHREEPAVWMHLLPKRIFSASQAQHLYGCSMSAEASPLGEGQEALTAAEYRHGRDDPRRAVTDRLKSLVARFEERADDGQRAAGPRAG